MFRNGFLGNTYDDHGDGIPEPARQANPNEPPLGIKLLLGFAVVSLVVTVQVGLQGSFELTALAIDALRIGLLLALLGMRPWAWTAYLRLQLALLALWGIVLLLGGAFALFKIAFGVIIVKYLYSIRGRYREDSSERAS